MAHIQTQQDKSKTLLEDLTEETFLKELHTYMKKRNTPIEKVPHLGFKQIDLYLMFRAVRKLGGYKQVTGQQLWKQVYNTLGGNPRSTSAATCTRRHYEKLLLPLECHLTGQVLKLPPQTHLHHFHYTDFIKDGDKHRSARHQLMPMLLHHNPHSFSSESHSSFHLPYQYSPYYNPGQAALPTYVHTPSSELNPHHPLALQQQSHYSSCYSNLDERIREPLEHLRYLAEQYKSSSGLAEPLNLSCKSTNRDVTPASSFALPSTSKNPKFLNKPSPLYPSKRVSRNEGHKTQDSDRSLGVTPCSSSPKMMEEFNSNHNPTTSSSNLTYDSIPATGPDTFGAAKRMKMNEDITTVAHESSPPKTDSTIQPIAEKDWSPIITQKECDLSHLQTKCAQENEDIMEIEVPLGVLQKWIRMFKPPVTLHEVKQQQPAPTQEEPKNYCTTEMLPTNPSFNIHSLAQKSIATSEDPRLRQMNEPSPPSTIQPNNSRDTMNPYDFRSYRSLPPGSFMGIPTSHDLCTFDQQAINTPYSAKPTGYWDAYNRKTTLPQAPLQTPLTQTPLQTPLTQTSLQTPVTQRITESSSDLANQDFASTKFSVHPEATAQRIKRVEVKPSAVLMLNSISGSVLHLTSEEVMKLKKIISSPP
ncbi:AT-rich interaction domain 6 isoform X2 [Thalassophryne amazonica]|uniref:AT-rich interaction domain 6 isoform X2 n=1 Tax=Thalassophryne amazonica TaxID=390379 RepID=UPI001471CBD1|nr:AT-rich interaction domain 6 isoform X2 [Thalassophryne amazonica]